MIHGHCSSMMKKPLLMILLICGSLAGVSSQTVDPGAQWIDNPQNGYKYIFSTWQKPWNQARLYCQAMGGDLLSISDDSELDWIKQKHTELQYVFSFWIGLYYNMDKWAWTDGHAFYPKYWDTGYPKNEADNMRGYYYLNAKFTEGIRNTHAAESYPFICKARQGATTPSTYPTTPTTGGFCPHGWVGDEKGNLCYKLYHLTEQEGGVTWSDAKALCRDEHAGIMPDLASFHNVLQSSAVISQMANESFAYWLGLNRKDAWSQWRWTDNSEYDYSKWAPGEPSKGYNEFCVEMWWNPGPIGTWNDAKCDLKRGYVCQTYKDPANFISTPSPTQDFGCKDGYTWFEDSCYKLDPTPRYWQDAEEECKMEGGHLTSIHSPVDNSALATSAIRYGNPVWIGFKDSRIDGDEGEYVWTDDWVAYYTNWGDTGRVEDGGCVSMRTDGKWYDTVCATKMASFCRITTADPITTPAHKEGSCPGDELGKSDWVGYGDYCYFASTGYANWKDAEAACHKMHRDANLASIHNFQENEHIAELLDYGWNSAGYWIGMFRANDMTYRWVDGTPVQYKNWASGEPNGESSNEHCVEMLTDNWPKQWNDYRCTYYNKYICKLPKQEVITPPTEVEGTCLDGWEPYGGHCYYFVPDVIVTFESAYIECQLLDETAYPASVHGYHENQFINDHMNGRAEMIDPLHYWLGMQRDTTGEDDFIWLDGSPVDYKAWASYEPSSYKDCVRGNLGTSYWQSQYCDSNSQDTNAYVCKMPKEKTGGVSSGTIAGAVIGGLIAAILLVIIVFVVLDKTGTMDVKKSADDTRKRIMGIINPNYQEFNNESGGMGAEMT